MKAEKKEEEGNLKREEKEALHFTLYKNKHTEKVQLK